MLNVLDVLDVGDDEGKNASGLEEWLSHIFVPFAPPTMLKHAILLFTNVLFPSSLLHRFH